MSAAFRTVIIAADSQGYRHGTRLGSHEIIGVLGKGRMGETRMEKDLVHRDLKPANVKMTPNGPVKVLDFELAKRGRASEVVLITLSAGYQGHMPKLL